MSVFIDRKLSQQLEQTQGAKDTGENNLGEPVATPFILNHFALHFLIRL